MRFSESFAAQAAVVLLSSEHRARQMRRPEGRRYKFQTEKRRPDAGATSLNQKAS
jgi:hypothetical protein